jgi:hypothetical protein
MGAMKVRGHHYIFLLHKNHNGGINHYRYTFMKEEILFCDYERGSFGTADFLTENREREP